MTAPLASDPATADWDDEDRCLYQVWEELTAHGFVIDEPVVDGTCQCFITHVRGIQCEIDLLITGALIWEYLPLAGTQTSPDHAARLVMTLLSSAGPSSRNLPPAEYPGMALKDTMVRVLGACGMTVRLVDVRYGDGSVCTQAVITNPAEPARGQVQVRDDGSLRWECFFSSAGGLTPAGVAQVITTALVDHRISGGQGNR